MSDIAAEINTFLSSSENKNLVIPPYQRNYSWEEKQLNDLWSDLSLLTSPAAKHFLGLLVLIKQDDCVEIVDGQQRITTIFLLFTALRDHVHELIRGKSVQDVIQYFVTYSELNSILWHNSKSVLKPNRNDKEVYYDLIIDYNEDDKLKEEWYKEHGEEGKEYFLDSVQFKENYFRKLTKPGGGKKYDFRQLNHKRHWKSYKYFHGQIKEWIAEKDSDIEKLTALRQIIEIVKTKLLVIEFKSNDTDAFNLFETLNDRGLGLAAVDLIKNHFLRKYDLTGDALEQVADSWDEMFSGQGKLSSSEHNTFMRHLHNSKNDFITKAAIYKAYKDEINSTTNDTERNNLLEFLKINCENFIKFKRLYDVNNKNEVSPYVTNDELFELLLILNKSGSIQWYSLAFPLFRIYNTASDENNEDQVSAVKDIFWLLVNIVVRFQILEIRFNYLEKRLPRLAKSLSRKVKYPVDEEPEDESNLDTFDTVDEAMIYLKEELKSIIYKMAPDSNLEAPRNLEDYEETFKDPENAVTVLFDENPVLSTVICKDYYSNSIAYILIRLYNLSKTGSNNTIRPMLSLEHVLPQKHATNWPEASEFAGRSIYQLGNMIMLKKELNSSASNLDYAAKKNLYTEQNVEDYLGTLSVLSIENQTDWNENLILQRSASVSNQVMKILKSMDYVTFSTYGNSSNEVDQS